MINRQKYLRSTAAAIGLCTIPFAWNALHGKPASHIFVLEKNIPVGQGVRVLWLNDDDVLLIRDVYFRSPGNFLPATRAEIRHLNTGLSEPIPDIPDSMKDPTNLDTKFEMTPDRRSLRIWNHTEFACIPLGEHNSKGSIKASSLDPQTEDPFINAVNLCPNLNGYVVHNKIPGETPATVSLYPNNANHWIRCADGDTGDADLLFLVGNDVGETSHGGLFFLPSRDCGDGVSQHLGLTHDGNILFYVAPGMHNMKTTPSELLEYKIGSTNPVHTYPVTLPIQNLKSFNILTREIWTSLSPDTFKIAWLLPYNEKSSKLDTFLRRCRILPPPPVQAIWVSDHFGHNMKLVETLPRQEGHIYGLDWTPDGRFITYRHVSGVDKQMRCTTTLCKISVEP